MSKITVLDQQTINQIAAGEVIERPAAVVKELVENAIDAGANAITIEIKEGGISFIRITDNGSGINKDDVKTAFLRHATSKIKSVEDLFNVASLGFRGEALSSIAAVALVELVTKSKSEFLGSRYLIEGGVDKGLEEIGCPDGTTFIVRNLFYNTPARRKFLKSAQTEAGYISDLVERLAISHPNISFRFLNNNQLKLTTSGNNKLKDIVYQIYGRDVTSKLLEVDASNEHITVNGFIGKPELLRGNRSYENYFINGRYIKSPVISKAIEDAYKPYAMTHRYPYTSLHFLIDPGLLDVNVHPTKMELRLRNSEEVYQMVYKTVSLRLKQIELIPNVPIENKPTVKATTSFSHSGSSKSKVTDALQRGPEPFEKQRIAASNQALSYIHKIQEDIVPKAKEETEARFISRKQAEETPGAPKDELPWVEVPVSAPVENAFSYEPSTLKEQESTYEVKTENDCRSIDEKKQPDTKAEQLTLFENESPIEVPKPAYHIIGQLFQTYWLIEFEEKLLLIDQHAAHEKVMYEKLMKEYSEKSLLSQGLLPPIIITLNPREEECIKENLTFFEELGFEIEHFGGKEWAVRSVPADLYNLNEESLLMELIDSLMEEHYNLEPMMIIEKIASMSCKAAVKGNQKLSYEEFSTLLDDLMVLENPYFCPHGRPIIIAMTKYEIEKKFKRIV